jgi:hypothetical protein
LVTFAGNARPGLASDTTVIFSPGATRPSTLTTPESHAVYPGASVRIRQISSGLAAIDAAAS